MTFKQLLVFSLLLQDMESIIYHAPSELQRIYDQAAGVRDPEALLETKQRALYERYIQTWESAKI